MASPVLGLVSRIGRTSALPRSVLRTYASVSAPSPFNHSDDSSPGQRARDIGSTSLRDTIERKRERKMAEYDAKLRLKALQEGVDVEELRRRATAPKPQPPVEQAPAATATAKVSEVEKRDQEVAKAIRQRAEKERIRKESGQAESPIKPLNSIIDTEKLASESTETISKLWTGYHTLKNKLSAAIPAGSYETLISRARKHPQFVLPLPREDDGFEIQFLEWAFHGDASTVLFTPLAEYKLKQEFAQPSLILTHYADMAEEKGVVLMRGEVTSEEGKQPRISQADAQLLTVLLQRFYLPSKDDKHSDEREKLLRTFYENPANFDVERLVKTAIDF